MRLLTSAPARASLVWLAPVLLCTPSARSAAPDAGPVIAYDQKLGRFEVTNLDAKALAEFAAKRPSPREWNGLFSAAVDGDPDVRVPMLGEYMVADGVLLFTPRFPLRSGAFVARLDASRLPGAAGAAAIEKRFRFTPPPPAGPPAAVAAVYPSADVLPENLLRLYVHFTAPMRRGEAYDHLRILDAAGKPIETPFLTLGEELWDPGGRRLTLLLDPGRVKHDLKPRQELGPVLEAGKSYTLVIDGRWRDAEGRPLSKEFRKAFKTVAAETRPVEPAGWKLQPPPAATREPVVVTFPKPLDHALLQHVMVIKDAAGRPVEGDGAVGEKETRWQFTPKRPWAAGEYVLEVDSVLEDVAGNRVGRAFEVDEERPAPGTVPPARRSFKIALRQ
jgi:hypothetical protein